MAEHVPAWKKLGLKLKFAKDMTGLPLMHTIANGSTLGPNEKRRKQLPPTEYLNNVPTTSQLPKRQKKFKSAKRSLTLHSPTPTLPSVETGPTEDIPLKPTVESATSPSIRKQKSVSFTPETKTADGEGTKKLYTAWLAQQNSDFDPTTAAQALRHVTPPSFGEHTAAAELKQKKVANKSEDSAVLKAVPASRPEPSPQIFATLQYLKDFYTSKSTWKFNKGKQNQILKYALNTFKIPPEYDPALYAYMSSIQSPATRKRVRDEALTVRLEDADLECGHDMSTEGESDAEDGEENDGTDDEDGDEESEDNSEAVVDKEVANDRYAGKAAAKAKRTAAKAARRQVENPRRKNYRQALRRYIKLLKAKEFEREEREKVEDPEWRARVLKRKRAELLLWSVGAADSPDESREIDNTVQLAVAGGIFIRPGTVEGGVVEGVGGESAAKRQKMNDGAARVVGKRKRKRKRRTGVPDDDSSSTESSSSSDSALSDTVGNSESRTSSNESTSSDEDASGEGKSGSGSESTDEGSRSTSEGGSQNGSENSDEKSGSSGSRSSNDNGTD